MMAVDRPAAKNRPPPAARPTAATAHTLAAVVRPRTVWPRAMMEPAPRKPMPDTTWAAMRDGSSAT